jgi:hypothetical protein
VTALVLAECRRPLDLLDLARCARRLNDRCRAEVEMRKTVLLLLCVCCMEKKYMSRCRSIMQRLCFNRPVQPAHLNLGSNEWSWACRRRCRQAKLRLLRAIILCLRAQGVTFG